MFIIIVIIFIIIILWAKRHSPYYLIFIDCRLYYYVF